jgi:hypothetical protein
MFRPGVLDSNLFAQEVDLLSEPVVFDLSLELAVHALRSPALRQGQGGPGKGVDLDNGRADTTGPASGKWKGTGLRGVGMTSLRKESRANGLAGSLTY